MRFITRDAIRDQIADPTTSNYYHYADGNPVMKVDPNGHTPLLFAIFWLGAGAVSGYYFARSMGWSGWRLGAAILVGAILGKYALANMARYGFWRLGGAVWATQGAVWGVRVGSLSMQWHRPHHGKYYHLVIHRNGVKIFERSLYWMRWLLGS